MEYEFNYFDMKIRHLFNAVAIAIALPLVSCTENLGVFQEDNPILFDISDNVTRGATVNTITSFGVSASVYAAGASYTSAQSGSYFFNTPATANSYMGYFWPTSDYKLSFFGYYPYGSNLLTVEQQLGHPVYTYSVPSDVNNQIDFMTASTLNVTCPSQSPVLLTFSHRLAAIDFTVYNTGRTSVTVKSITLKGFKYSGRLNNSSWTLLGSANTSSVNPFVYSPNMNLAADDEVDVSGSNGHIMTIPQTVLSGTEFLELVLTINEEDKMFTSTLESNFNFIMGKKYRFNLNVSDNSVEISSVAVIDWDVTPVETIGATSPDWAYMPISTVFTEVTDWQNGGGSSSGGSGGEGGPSGGDDNNNSGNTSTGIENWQEE